MKTSVAWFISVCNKINDVPAPLLNPDGYFSRRIATRLAVFPQATYVRCAMWLLLITASVPTRRQLLKIPRMELGCGSLYKHRSKLFPLRAFISLSCTLGCSAFIGSAIKPYTRYEILSFLHKSAETVYVQSGVHSRSRSKRSDR